MMYVVDMESDGMIAITSLMKIGAGVQKLSVGIRIQTQANTRTDGDVIS
jgi:hypothetical protein